MEISEEPEDEREARQRVRLVVMDVLMTKTDVHPEKLEAATTAIMRAMQAPPTRWAFRVHSGGSRL